MCKYRKLSVGELGLNLCGALRDSQRTGTVLIITNRRAATHVVIPVNENINPEQLAAWATEQLHISQEEESHGKA